MRVLALAGGKGGVGKTTVAVHLAVGLAKQGRRTLLVDLDPTGHATSWMLGLEVPGGKGTADALREERIEGDYIQEIAGRERLQIMPATRSLASLELSLGAQVGAHTILGNLLEDNDSRWDYAILDCPPGLGFYTLTALCAAHAVVSPIPCTPLALAGLGLLEEHASLARKRLKVEVELLGALLFAADAREGITEETRKMLDREAPGMAFRSEVRVSAAGKALPAQHATAWDAGADPRGFEDYPAVLRETLTRLEGHRARKKTA